MNTNRLEKFAQAARLKLIGIVRSKLHYVLSSDSAELREKKQQLDELRKVLSQKGKEELIEEVAYTWFNRFIALRFMDANGYTDIKAVSPLPGHTQPEILQVFKGGHCPQDLPVEKEKLYRILDGSIPARDPQNEVYRFLLLGVCNSWNKKMPFMFQKLHDYSELLMPDDLLSEHSILAEINENILDDDCRDVEIIGWLYQFYVSEKKDAVIGSKQKIKPEDIPAATQLFTPNWIVRYLLENSLGRLWMLNHPDSRLQKGMDYYIRHEEEETEFLKIKSPQEISVCDPACGSGHMLTYAFDMFVKMYEEEGYDKPEIANLILEKNLYGIEIDRRAAALSAFALTMKARGFDQRFFRRDMASPNIICLEKTSFEKEELNAYKDAVGDDLYTAELEETLFSFDVIDSVGSLLKPALLTPEYYLEKLKKMDLQKNWVLKVQHDKVLSVLRQACYLARKYHCVVANPPYMGNNNMNDVLKEFAKKNYPDSKSDLFAMFIERGFCFVVEKGYNSMVTMQSWMFLSSFEKLREKILKNVTIESMVHMANMVMGIAFGTSATVWNKRYKPDFKGKFSFVDYKDLDEEKKPFEFPVRNERLSISSASDFKKIPGSPIAYWVSDKLRRVFADCNLLSKIAVPRAGLTTGNNPIFQRIWHEVVISNIAFDCKTCAESLDRQEKWYPCNSGGEFRKWYGNNEILVNWQYNGIKIRNYINENGKLGSRPQNTRFYFQSGITWTKLSSSNFAARYKESGFIFDDTGRSAFSQKPNLNNLLLGFLCSKLSSVFLKVLNPTMSFTSGDISNLPIEEKLLRLNGSISQRAIDLVRLDWDSYERSWNYRTLPLLKPDYRQSKLEVTYQKLRSHWQDMTLEMQRLEEDNNRIFIDAYGLQDELTPDVPLKEITLTCNPHYRYGDKKNVQELESLLLADTMREFISYAVGCMFGRYSLDKPGLILANQGETVEDYIRHVGLPKDKLSFVPDEDNVLPITEGEYFSDDIVARFKRFLKAAFGEDHYEENLAFIESSIGKDIRKYFLSDFYAHHVRMYKKRAIYWLFSSPGKSFNALIYMHRYHPDTVSNVLNDYLRQYIRKLEAQKKALASRAGTQGLSGGESARIQKEMNDINRQLRELAQYERNVLYPLAAQRKEIDLDDGVKVNYAMFGEALSKI